MEVCVIKPTSIEDGREITETLLANRTVVLNLEGLDVDIAQRIIDFTPVPVSQSVEIFRRFLSTYLLLRRPAWIFPEIFRISSMAPLMYQEFGKTGNAGVICRRKRIHSDSLLL